MSIVKGSRFGAQQPLFPLTHANRPSVFGIDNEKEKSKSLSILNGESEQTSRRLRHEPSVFGYLSNVFTPTAGEHSADMHTSLYKLDIEFYTVI